MVVRNLEANQFLERLLLEQQRGSRERWASTAPAAFEPMLGESGIREITGARRRSIHPSMANAEL